MKKIFNRFATKLIAILVVVLVAVIVREKILTDKYTAAVFSGLMQTLPFSKAIVDVVTKVLKCSYAMPKPTAYSTVTDVFKLAIMACVQPVLVGLITRIFLPVPTYRNQILLYSGKKSYELQEDYMNSGSFRIKSLLITIITAPLLALGAAWLTDSLFAWLTVVFGNVGAIVLGSLSTVCVLVLSLSPLLKAGLSLGTSILWRLLITLMGKMVTTFFTNALCWALYLAILDGSSWQITGTVVTLVVWLIIMDLALQLMRRSVAAF